MSVITFTERGQITHNKERFYKRRTKYVTEETKKDIFDSTMNALNQGHGINEYGDERRELQGMRLYYSAYYDANVYSYDGKVGDWGIGQTIILDRRADTDELKKFLELFRKWLEKKGYIYSPRHFSFDMDL